MNIEYDEIPKDLDAEYSLLGSVVLEPARMDEARAEGITSKDFFLADNAVVFAALESLTDRREPIDVISLRAELIATDQYKDVGGWKELAKLLNVVPWAGNARNYAKVVKKHSRLREAMSIADKIIHEAKQRDASPDVIALEATINYSRIGAAGGTRTYTIAECADEVIEGLKQNKPRRIRTGFSRFDYETGGVPIAGFTQVAGRPGMGKSQFVKQMLANMAANGETVGLVTVEESHTKIGENLLSNLGGIENHKIAYNTLCEEEWRQIEFGRGRLNELPYYVADEPVEIADVCGAITKLAVIHGCTVVAVDYLQLISSEGDNRTHEVTKISNALKMTFKRLRVAGIAAVQLNRANEQAGNRRPVLRDLRDAGTLEQDGDLIVLLHSDDYYRRLAGEDFRDGKLLAIVAKNKDGPCADIPLRQDNKTQRITEFEDVPDFSYAN